MSLKKKFVIVFVFLFSTLMIQGQSEFSSSTISIGVIVSDIDVALDFYINVLGMQKTGGFNIDTSFAKKSGLSNGVPFSVTTLKLQDEQHATQWKLMSFGKMVKRPKSKYIQDDVGMQYITVFVKALKPFIKRIEENHVTMLGETPVSLGGETHFILVQDPDGTFIELIGPME